MELRLGDFGLAAKLETVEQRKKYDCSCVFTGLGIGNATMTDIDTLSFSLYL